jgi:hypothetical protein
MRNAQKVLIVAFLVICSCKKDKSDPFYFGTASMTLNGKVWNASKVRCVAIKNHICNPDFLSLDFEVYNEQGFLRESLDFKNIFKELKTYYLWPNAFSTSCKDSLPACTYYTIGADGDVILDVYNTLPNSGSFIRIDKFNNDTKEMEGVFSFDLLIYSRYNPTAPDTLRVRNGQFYTKIFDSN